jgi:hypothetical protein
MATSEVFAVAGIVVLCAVVLILVGPKLTVYSRRQWALMMATLLILWIPMGAYLLFVVGSSKIVDSRQVLRAGALNLGIGVPIFILIGRRILKIGKYRNS